MRRIFVLGVFCHLALASQSFANNNGFNSLILSTVQEMPQGGGYSTRRDAFDALLARIQLNPQGSLAIRHDLKAPSFCSGATYVAFMKVMEKLQRTGELRLSPAAARKLLVKDERGNFLADGFGVWGRWNANGPGTAGLFHDLNLGENFADDGFYEARPGDFLKIFWKWGRGVGRYERGHSVVYTRVIPEGARGRDVQQVCFWSSHGFEDGRESGMGEKCVPRSDIQEMIFSRLHEPARLNDVLGSNFKHENTYLSSLLDVESNIEEARRETNTRVYPPLWNE